MEMEIERKCDGERVGREKKIRVEEAPVGSYKSGCTGQTPVSRDDCP